MEPFLIRPLGLSDLPRCGQVIRESFSTVAKGFGWTSETDPGFTAFVTDETLLSRWNENYYPYGLFVGEDLVGFVSLLDKTDGVYEMCHLAVLEKWRHFGFGKALVDLCKEEARKLCGSKIVISIVKENTLVRAWYIDNGFVPVETRKFDHLPFTVEYMEW